MKIFNYDKISKEFLFEDYAQENPVKKGEFLFPPNSTTIVPPQIKENQTLVFADNYWKIIPDYRGLEQINVVNHEVSIVENIGELNSGFMLLSEYIKTNDYKLYIREQEKLEVKENILSQLEDLDTKRIRALCEPSVKNEENGETWLDFYNSKINELRQQLMEVENA